MYRVVSLALTFLLVVSGLLGLMMLTPLATATATDTHYFVDSSVEPLCDDDWGTADCWSHTSGGAGGAGVPGSSNDVVFDANSGGNTVTAVAAISVHDIVVMDWSGQEVDFSGDLSFHNLNVFYTSTSDQLTFASDVAVQTTSFSGSVTVNSGSVMPGQEHFQFTTANPPSDPLLYTGPNDFGTISYTGLIAHDASGGPTIYCFPGCSDLGGNTNILFQAPPATGGGPAPTITAPPFGPTFKESTAIVGLVLFVSGASVLYLGVVMRAQRVRRAGVVVLVVGAAVLFVAFVFL